MLSRIVAVAAVIVALMIAVKDGAMGRTGLVGTCKVVQTAPDGTQWTACKSGRLQGRPSLASKSCTSWGLRGKLEYWHCPTPVESTASAR
jgi:hypothetical protein